MNKKSLHVQPSELKFPFQLNRLSTCWLQLTNKIDENVVFKVKTTHPKKYCVRPNVGIISPGSTCVVKVVLQAQKEFPLAIPKDKFLVQSITAPVGLTVEEITSQMFRKDSDDLGEQKLRVVFSTVDPPSPIPEGSEEECSPMASDLDRKSYIASLFDSASTIAEEGRESLWEVSSYANENNGEKSQNGDMVSKLKEERSRMLLENQKLRNELEMARRQTKRTDMESSVVVLVALFACLLGFIVGYVIK